ncbi:cytoplasmic protein [Bacillus sp. FJAT-27231]|uniref:YwqG family protein n=1 Tax=Bacillus sp. FJAT-27231 TaxID=1679168 RepID=UPI00067110B8|nr:YwqG family protein [Bacillus sp. FJAT-27231]KMY55595.1 cytoplasmic protein [Bacillus sp. FJAT-27231]
MSAYHSLNLPKELEPYREELEQTVEPVVKITGTCARTGLLDSKFGGQPYLPKGMEHPKDEHGDYLSLLAQINFAEVPPIAPFPEKGILQFYIAGEDDLLGMDFEDGTNQENFRILYHPDVTEEPSELVTDFSYMKPSEEGFFPVEHEIKLSFELGEEPISEGDYRMEQLSFDLYGEASDGTELGEIYAEALGATGSKIGGYPFFTQEDPRSYREKYQNHQVLLLQVDTDTDLDIMWGDSGVGNFFITKEDLKNRNFANVLYNWDCC